MRSKDFFVQLYEFCLLKNFGPDVIPISYIVFILIAPFPFLFELATVARFHVNFAGAFVRLKAFLLVLARLDLLRVGIEPEILVALLVMARMQLNLVATWFYTICGVGVELDVAIVSQEVMLMARWLNFIVATVVHAHLFVKASQ